MQVSAHKPYKGISMEGTLADWYAKNTRGQMPEFQRLATELTKDLPAGARILEVAPGPGYLAVELAKRGPFKVTGLDISQSFVRMASEYAKGQGVTAHFIHGSVSDIPLEDGFFDLIVCRAAFKNFAQPLQALNEMHRVLKPGGRAMIIDLRQDASWSEIESFVNQSGLRVLDAWFTKMTFKHMLLKRAYTRDGMGSLIRSSAFQSGEIASTPIGMEIQLVRTSPLAQQAA